MMGAAPGTSSGGIGLSGRSPDSWCKQFHVDNASLKSERFLNGPVFPDLLREIHQFCLCRKCKIVHFDTNFFISIMLELGCTKYKIFQKAIVDPFEMLLDASLKLWA